MPLSTGMRLGPYEIVAPIGASKTVELCRRYQPSELPEPLGQSARQHLLAANRRIPGARKNSSP